MPYHQMGMMCSSESFMASTHQQPHMMRLQMNMNYVSNCTSITEEREGTSLIVNFPLQNPCFPSSMSVSSPMDMGVGGSEGCGGKALSTCTALPAHPPVSQGVAPSASHASASDSCSQISHVLQCYQQVGHFVPFST